jgi:hypothetical protein
MSLDDRARDPESEACTDLLLGCKERFEDAVLVFFGYSWSIIFHRQIHIGFLP